MPNDFPEDLPINMFSSPSAEPSQELSAPLPELVQAIRTNRRLLARLITRIENGQADHDLSLLYPYTGHAHIIGITGSPGTGKSSLVNALTVAYRQAKRTVGIIAVDPTSPFSGGAILGDRIRMRDLIGDPGVFIRSMATRGSLGGLSAATRDVVRALDAAQFDIILIETVGAGQSEVDIARAAHTTLVIEAPGMGDDIQAIKAGILEIADILVVNKSDQPGVENTVRALRAMLDLGHRSERLVHHGRMLVAADRAGSGTANDLPDENTAWQVPINQTVATADAATNGISDLVAKIDAHRLYLHESGVLAIRMRAQLENEILERLRDALLARILTGMDAAQLSGLLENVLNRQLDPNSAAKTLLDAF